MPTIETPDALIDALGGTAAVSTMLGVGTAAVSNWRSRGFPGWTLNRLRDECEVKGIIYAEAILTGRPPAKPATGAAA